MADVNSVHSGPHRRLRHQEPHRHGADDAQPRAARRRAVRARDRVLRAARVGRPDHHRGRRRRAPSGLGYARTPTDETPEQMAAWKKIADAVHAKGGRMFMQFMHVGRIGHSANRYTKEPLVAPSARPRRGTDVDRHEADAGPRHAARARDERDSRRHRAVRRGDAQRARRGLRRRRAAFGVGLPADAVPVVEHQPADRRVRRQRPEPHPLRRRSARGDGEGRRARRRTSASRSAPRCRSTTSTTRIRSRPTRRW